MTSEHFASSSRVVNLISMALALFRTESDQRINVPIRTNTQRFCLVRTVRYQAKGFSSPQNPTRAIRDNAAHPFEHVGAPVGTEACDTRQHSLAIAFRIFLYLARSQDLRQIFHMDATTIRQPVEAFYDQGVFPVAGTRVALRRCPMSLSDDNGRCRCQPRCTSPWRCIRLPGVA